jgi:hypothetical protein
MRGELGGRRRFPHDGVAHQRRRARQVGGDGSEIEGRHRIDKTFERPVVDLVPHAGGRDRLFRLQAQHEFDVEAEEVHEFRRRIDLGLVDRLGLAEHGRGVERRPPGARGEVGGLEENRRAFLPGAPGPVVRRPPCRIYRLLHLGSIRQVRQRQHPAMIVWLDGFLEPAGAHFPAVDYERQLDTRRLELSQPRFDGASLRRARCIGQYWFICWLWDLHAKFPL